MTPEKVVQNAIIDYCKKLYDAGFPVWCERRQAGGFSYKTGIPDLYIVVNGVHIEVEVKRPGGQLRPMQEKFRDKCIRLHIAWMCADNVEDVKTMIRINFGIFL